MSTPLDFECIYINEYPGMNYRIKFQYWAQFQNPVDIELLWCERDRLCRHTLAKWLGLAMLGEPSEC